MPASTSILDEKAFYGETLGTHSGHKLNLCHREYYDSAAVVFGRVGATGVVFVSEYGIECDMYEGCGAMILDNIKTREEALEIMETIQNTGKAEPTFTRSKGGTAEREEIISQIQVPDLWDIIQAMKHGTTISKKEGQRLVAAIEETWQLAHDMRKHLQSNG
jgi:hypothetical protein